MKLVSIDNPKAQMHAKIRLIGQLGPFMAGTFVRKANNGSVAYTVTSKVAGKTKSIYVPVDLADEVGIKFTIHKGRNPDWATVHFPKNSSKFIDIHLSK